MPLVLTDCTTLIDKFGMKILKSNMSFPVLNAMKWHIIVYWFEKSVVSIHFWLTFSEIMCYFRFETCYLHYSLIKLRMYNLLDTDPKPIWFFILVHLISIKQIATSRLHLINSGWLFQDHMACNLTQKVP